MNKRTNSQIKLEQISLIKNKLINVGIEVHLGKKKPKRDGYSGIVGEEKEVLELNI